MSALSSIQTRPRNRRASLRPWWPWLATFAAFPPAGLLGRAVAGPVDSATAAAIAGLTAGAVLGAGQWLLLRRRGVSTHWIVATAAGFTVGLTVGAGAVGFRTDHSALMIMGALSGAFVGMAQAASARTQSVAIPVWGLATAALWALGWTVSSGVIDVTDQWPVFGSSGALLVVLLQSAFIARVLQIANTNSTRKVAS